MNLSIIIVNYNTGALTQSLIESLLNPAQKLPRGSEIIVVDNSSHDDSVAFLRSDYPEVTVLPNQQNLGLSGGVNIGLKAATGDYILLLNPDIIALPGSVAALLDFMRDHDDVGLAGGQLLSPNGKLQYSSFRFYTPLTVLYRRTFLGRTAVGRQTIRSFLMKDTNHREPHDADWLMGSCLMLRGAALQQVGGMDERFFLYFEDVDWCRRFWEKGWRVTYVPSARFSHFHQRSSRHNALLGIINNWTTREHIRSAIKYFWKYRGKPAPRIR